MINVEETKMQVLPQYVAALTATLNGLAVGTLVGWTSPAHHRLLDGEYSFPVNDIEFSWIGSSMTLGATCSCIPIGFLINLIGRKHTMLSLVLPITLGWCVIIWAQNIIWLYVARFLLGISGGAYFVVVPIYTAEIAHKSIRGRLSCFFQLQLTGGILFVYIIGSFLAVFWMSIVCGIIPIIFAIIFFFMPESPLYFISKEKYESAIKSIQWLRGKKYDYNPEMDELKQVEQEIREQRKSIKQALLRRVTLKALGILFGLIFFQQLSGINAVIFYSTHIFKNAQTGINEHLSSIAFGSVQMVATFASVMTVDKLGRRFLLLTSALIMTLSTTAMGTYFYMKSNDAESVKALNWLPVTSICLFIITFAFGFGPVPWLMLGELFASNVKGVAAALIGTFHWILAFAITKSFVNFTEVLGTGPTFWLFASLTLLGAIFVFICVPETKGKSLNEIQRMLESTGNTTNNANDSNKN